MDPLLTPRFDNCLGASRRYERTSPRPKRGRRCRHACALGLPRRDRLERPCAGLRGKKGPYRGLSIRLRGGMDQLPPTVVSERAWCIGNTRTEGQAGVRVKPMPIVADQSRRVRSNRIDTGDTSFTPSHVGHGFAACTKETCSGKPHGRSGRQTDNGIGISG